jgi:hypothetical protein
MFLPLLDLPLQMNLNLYAWAINVVMNVRNLFIYNEIKILKDINNLFVEISTTRGTTALVYCLINNSLYTATVQWWWSTPNWLGGQ